MEGKPLVTSGNVFTDVTDRQWCAPAITWAVENGILNGYGNGNLNPGGLTTCAQVAQVLMNFLVK